MSEEIRSFRVIKSTNTHADVLIAAGLAGLLQDLFDEPILVEDEAAHFRVTLPEALPSTLNRLPHSPRYPWILGRSGAQVPHGLQAINMSAEFERVKRWSENRRKLRGQRQVDPVLLQAVQEDAPLPRWWLLPPLAATKLKAGQTWNRVAESIAASSADAFRADVLKSLRSMVSGPHPKVKWRATSNGLFSPAQIKGFNELKPRGTSRGSMPVNAFEEWLRYLGYWSCAGVTSDSDNIRVYVPIPARLTPRALDRLALELEKQSLPGCGPKSDALAVIALARLLIEHSEEYHTADIEPFPGLNLRPGESPANLVSGLHVTHYAKTSRQAYGVRSMAVLALPGWFSISAKEDANVWLDVVREHQRVVMTLQEDRSDEIGLVLTYRRFLERRGSTATWALIEFMERYGSFVMRANGSRVGGRVRWTPRFTDEYLRRILMGSDNHLLQIINDPGFEAVARALRQATVTSQNKRARQQDVWREIRYDLLHDIHRTRKVPGDAFLECITQFISRYNYENARRREITKNPKAAPANISDDELKSFVGLISCHGASVVGALLAAYGTCKEKWEPDEEDSGAAPVGPVA
jgi:hypothetical protein